MGFYIGIPTTASVTVPMGWSGPYMLQDGNNGNHSEITDDYYGNVFSIFNSQTGQDENYVVYYLKGNYTDYFSGQRWPFAHDDSSYASSEERLPSGT